MAARIHHLNCATMCPYGRRWLAGEGKITEKAELVAHVLAIESDDGLVLVDTGLGTGDVANPPRTGAFFRHLVRPEYRIEETAIEQLRGLGFDPVDVRHVVLTHLDVDHAGGLPDFPGAQIHVFETELEAVRDPNFQEKLRYVQAQWAHGPKWQQYATEGDTWFGFESVRAIEGLDVEIAIVPLTGHTRGHSGIAIRRESDWLLHCGDAYFHRAEMEVPPAGPAGIAVFEALTEIDGKARKANQQRLRELKVAHGDEITLFSAHDKVEFERLSAAGGPSGRLARGGSEAG